jgi:serine/threonine-protein kinase
MSESLPGRSSDRNLLFGILALQTGFIRRDQLVTALRDWALAREKPLGRVLREQGALDADACALLEALAEKHVQLHDDDPQQSLATVSYPDWVRQQLEPRTDADLPATATCGVAPVREDADCGARPVGAAGVPSSSGLRFRILRPHARGGLGEVYIARDEELRREVALKEMRPRYAEDPRSRARFLLEAQVTGDLEHPGVVPVYGLGAYPDGRPFYAMRFIKGDSLKQAIDRFHQAEGQHSDPGGRALAFRALLGRFVDVCQTVAYAHSRGVLHRDLKPANVMLGDFGETLVVDWGAAKILRKEEGAGTRTEPDPTAPDAASPPNPAASSLFSTETGQLLGTPAFMSPEQAAGRLDLLGPASDIYGLGATLYALLTGHAPVEGSHHGDIIRRVIQGDWPRPGAVKQHVPKALEVVCCKAMALKPEDRYATAQELAGEVERWLADAAYRQDLSLTYLNLGVLLLNQGDRPAARDALERSVQMKEQLAAELRDAPGYRQDLAYSYNNLGAVRAYLGELPAARTTFEKALKIRQQLAAEFPTRPEYRRDLAVSHENLAHILADQGERSAARAEYEEALRIEKRLAADFPTVPAYRQHLAASRNGLGNLLAALGERAGARAQYEQAIDIQQRLAADSSDVPAYRIELGGSCCNYGNLVRAEGKPAAALEWYAKAQPPLESVLRQVGRDANARRFLRNVHLGRAQALDQLLPLVYDELRKLAVVRLAHDKPGQTLQPTALVHEAYVRLVGGPDAAEAVADFGVHAALVVGTPWRVDSENPQHVAKFLETLKVTLRGGKDFAAEGEGRNALGNPLLALGFLARVLATQSWAPPLTPGEIITTGTLTALPDLFCGEAYHVEVTGAPLASLHLELSE